MHSQKQMQMHAMKAQSQETKRYSGKTGRLNRNLYVISKFTKWPKTPGVTSKKTLLSLKGISCLQVILDEKLDETNADVVQFTKRWIWKWILLQKVCSYKYQFCIKAK